MSFQADSPTFTGAVVIPEPSDPTHAASQGYVDTANAKIKRGSATFADTNYRITLAPSGNVASWYADKAVGGFTIHTSGNLTGDVDWVAAHD
ncbi:MAG: hypothetical protein ABIO70_01790 [Pseudomonadota bacterium]